VIPKTILVVEDDADSAFYRSALMIARYRVIAVEHGIEALRRIDDRPDLVLLDVELPRLGGRDVHAELKAHADTQDIPVMVVSAADTRDLNPEDFACVMRKPITADELIAAVDSCLRKLAVLLPVMSGMM
jgi:DNA-binding response OmpR family regulator